jgi:hypothetical protein
MDGSCFNRVLKFARHAAARPGDLRRYLDHRRTTPLEIGLPWFSYAAIDFLETYLKPDMSVFEYGAGGSTVFFASRVSRVVSREPDEKWLSLTRNRVSSCQNVEFISGGHVDAPFYVIVIDHDEPPYNPQSDETREQTFEVAKKFVKPGGIIIVDDSWRHRALRREGHVKVFEGLGPCRLGVTSTDVYFF